MFNLTCDRKGITMVEVLVSLSLLSIGILALLTLLPSSWRLAGRSDFLGRASGILLNQLQVNEASILNPQVAIAEGTTTATIYPSMQTTGLKKPGDVSFTVDTTLKDLGGSVWLVTVKVTWPGNDTGISESMRVIRQQNWSG